MRKRNAGVGGLLILLFSVITGYAQKFQISAFPGAEGHGIYVTGGRRG